MKFRRALIFVSILRQSTGLRERNTWLQTRHGQIVLIEGIVNRKIARRKPKGRPDVYVKIRRAEVWSHDADHAIGQAIQRKGTPDHILVAAKPALPGFVTEHDFMVCVGLILFRREGAAKHRLRAEDVEPLPGKLSALQPLRPSARRVIEIRGSFQSGRSEDWLAIAYLRKIWRRGDNALHPQFAVAHTQYDYPLRVGNARRVKK